MNIAYLVNQYPKTSHSFIRREIAALESLGLTIQPLHACDEQPRPWRMKPTARSFQKRPQ